MDSATERFSDLARNATRIGRRNALEADSVELRRAAAEGVHLGIMTGAAQLQLELLEKILAALERIEARAGDPLAKMTGKEGS